jgi:preprotein translocase subunit SecG
MLTVLAILQGILVISMVLLVLIQRTSSDGMANLASSGAKSIHGSVKMDFIKKSTIFFAVAFIINSIIIANMSYHINNSNSINKYIEENKDESDD